MTGVGVRLKEWRKSQGLSQGQLAAKLGMALRTYWRFETQGRKLRSDALATLAELGCDAAWLLTGKGGEPHPGGARERSPVPVQSVLDPDISLATLIAEGLAPRLLQAGISPQIVGERLIAYGAAIASKTSGRA